ncbi:nuclear protein export protein [Moniliophthora roreri MCA 2997]|uniref:Nuclear protein export protein n=1 Tax=Moniliophthora roreri (strain MCA 2997) TaxID=1381753 RepID=V2X547_MONRO|nr:nuclear protein export protein [Moniliophthora roreri MCA 2997]
MSDSPRSRTPELGIQHRNSPPPSPPSPSFTETEAKQSRKREREVSLEPAGPSISSSNDSEEKPKDTRTPAKKNRINLGPTTEEEEHASGSRSRSNSPPLSVSPPTEMKIRVRQISQGVEDLSWRNRVHGSNNNGAGVVEPIKEDVQDANMNEDQLAPSATTTQAAESLENDKETTANGLGDITPPEISQGSSMSASRRDSESDSGDKDKGLKRKYLERGTSAGPQDDAKDKPSESTKRQRDDADKDDNPRETKRPSPPPESEKAAPAAAAPKPSGFMAYASTSSPFASVKGQNIFASSKPSSPKPQTPLGTSTPPSPLVPETSTSSTTPAKRSGFEAFASSSSPFLTATRSKSPVLGSSSKFGRSKSPPRRANSAASSNAFSSYASSGMQGFALPPQKRARAGSPGSGSSVERNTTAPALGGSGRDSGAEDDGEDRPPSTFGERLRAGRDEDEGSGADEDSPRMNLTEKEVSTGEEEEETIHQVRGKLFHLTDGAWRERGTGLLKLNVRASDGGGARLVMRKEAVYTVILNVTLFHGMRCVLAQDPRYLRFSVIEGGVTTHYNLRLANAKIAAELLEEIHSNLPSA